MVTTFREYEIGKIASRANQKTFDKSYQGFLKIRITLYLFHLASFCVQGPVVMLLVVWDKMSIEV